MYPVNIALKPISQISTKSALQPIMTQDSAAAEQCGNGILDAIRSVLDYIFKYIFTDASNVEQQAAWTWASSTYKQNESNPDDGRIFSYYEMINEPIEIEFFGKKIISISAGPSTNVTRVSWIIKDDISNKPVVYKNDFSWME